MTVSPNGIYVAVGFSSGVISILDVRTGVLLASWKAHEGEILQVKELISLGFGLYNKFLCKIFLFAIYSFVFQTS